ncbi:MAG TPA: dihydroxy-acid dehydratase, partial [Stellaceae bacterium]|nr:dihydroxy-acid dehydratase [Stellaceae bacterium]
MAVLACPAVSLLAADYILSRVFAQAAWNRRLGIARRARQVRSFVTDGSAPPIDALPPDGLAGKRPPRSPSMTDPIGLARGLTNYGDRDFALYLRRSFAKSMGYSAAMLAKPVIGIANTASGFNNCHRLVPELVDAVKRGVLAAGALPIEFPTISLGEVFLNPTSLKFR